MASLIALDNKTEADRIYHRAIQRWQEQHSNQKPPWFEALQVLSGARLSSDNDWYWVNEQGRWQTAIADLLIIEQFMPLMPKGSHQ